MTSAAFLRHPDRQPRKKTRSKKSLFTWEPKYRTTHHNSPPYLVLPLKEQAGNLIKKCHFTLEKCHFTLEKCHFTLEKCHFTLEKSLFTWEAKPANPRHV